MWIQLESSCLLSTHKFNDTGCHNVAQKDLELPMWQRQALMLSFS